MGVDTPASIVLFRGDVAVALKLFGFCKLPTSVVALKLFPGINVYPMGVYGMNYPSRVFMRPVSGS